MLTPNYVRFSAHATEVDKKEYQREASNTNMAKKQTCSRNTNKKEVHVLDVHY